MYKLVILSVLLAVASAAPKPGGAIISGGAQYTIPAAVAAVETAPVVAAYSAPAASVATYNAVPYQYQYASPIAYTSNIAAPIAYSAYSPYSAYPIAYNAPASPIVYSAPGIASYSAATYKPASGENHGYAVAY